MAGISADQVYLLGPDQSKTTGAINRAPLGTTVPTDARSALATGFVSSGYVSENGITVNVSRSTTTVKDWGLNNVRVATTDFGVTITGEFLQVDQFAAESLVGADNVTVTPATQTAGQVINIGLGPDLPEPGAFVFNMVDGERAGRVVVPNGQITEIGSPTFVKGSGNVWPFTLSCYDDGTGHSCYVILDDGVFTA